MIFCPHSSMRPGGLRSGMVRRPEHVGSDSRPRRRMAQVDRSEHATCYDPSNYWSALTDGRTKYIYYATDGWQQLFDLTEDRARPATCRRWPSMLPNSRSGETACGPSCRAWRTVRRTGRPGACGPRRFSTVPTTRSATGKKGQTGVKTLRSAERRWNSSGNTEPTSFLSEMFAGLRLAGERS